jgi:hypothetical protein
MNVFIPTRMRGELRAMRVTGLARLLECCGGFIIKDLVLLAAALWTAGEALGAATTVARRP